jgi:hypothetical protein
MRGSRQPYTWSEDFDETLNFWVWLWKSHRIDEAGFRLRVQQWAGLDSYAGHLTVVNHPCFAEYVSVGQAWKNAWVQRSIEDARSGKARAARARFRAMKAMGVRIRVEWVMAAFGERWLFPPDLAVLGVEGSAFEGRVAAVLEAAQALH